MNIKLVNAAVNARLTNGGTTVHDHNLLVDIMDNEEIDLYLSRVQDAHPGECVVVDQFDDFKPVFRGPYAEWMRENMTPFR
jgi:hypothetical protein